MASTRVGVGVSAGGDSQETIISVQNGDCNLSRGDIENLRSLDEGVEEESGQALIQRVPSMLRENKHFHKYFKPKVISIGPLHHNDPGLQGAEKLKLKLAAHFIKSNGGDKEMLYSKVKMEIGNLKKCYDPKEIREYYDDDEKLSWMLFVDGCTILQAIYLRYAPAEMMQNYNSNEVNIKNDLLTFLYLDLLLLENQIPYRILELLTSSSIRGQMFKEAIKRFVDYNVTTPAEKTKEENEGKQAQQQQHERRQPAHLLELLRSKLVGETEKEKRSRVQGYGCGRLLKYIVTYNQKGKPRHHSYTFRNVKELREAGIWLRASESSCLRDISFNRVCCVGKLRLPPITVDDSTGPKFMNLIAYEMCPHFDNDFAVTSYICFLDSIIDEAEDVKALRDAGILHNGMGSDEEVAKLFNKMNTDLVPSQTMYSEVKMQIQNHCNNMWITNAAQAYHTHFRSPWTFLAFMGAMAALVLSALQTYYTMHPV